MNNNQGSSGLLSTIFATTGALALALAAGGYAMAKHQQAPRPESKQKSERPAEESPEVLAERLRHQEEKSKLATKLALLNQELVGLKKAQEISQDENTRLTTRLQQAEAKEKASSAKFLAAQEKAISLESDLANSQKELSELREQLAAKESQLGDANEASANQVEQISTLSARAENAEANEKTSLEQLVTAQEQVTSLGLNLANSQNELIELRDQLADKEIQLVEAKQTSANQAEKISILTTSLQEAKEEEEASLRGAELKSIFGRLSESQRLQLDKKGRAHSCIGCLIQSDNPVLLKFVVSQLALSHGLTSGSLRGWLGKKYKDLSQKDRAEFEQCREKLFGENVDTFPICSGFSFSSNSRGGSGSFRQGFDFERRGSAPLSTGGSDFDFRRRGSASSHHNQIDSSLSNTSLISDQGEVRSRTSSFSQN